jgi:protein phosphatase
MIQIFSTTDTGLVRTQNEDRYGTAETQNSTICVVCDGMGGHAGGETASKIAVDCILQFLSEEKYTDIRAALSEAFEFANMQILGAASENSDLKGMGTTACVLVYQGDKAWIAHAGDSRIYLYVAKEKHLHRLTCDHSYVQGLMMQGLITEDEIETHPQKNRILKALGMQENVKADVALKPILPAKGDIFLICTDGLFGMVKDKEIYKILSAQSDMKQKQSELLDSAKKAGGTDNITFQLLQVKKSPHKKSVYESKSHLNKPKKYKSQLLINVVSMIVTLLIGLALGFWMGYEKQNSNQKVEKETPIETTKTDESENGNTDKSLDEKEVKTDTED